MRTWPRVVTAVLGLLAWAALVLVLAVVFKAWQSPPRLALAPGGGTQAPYPPPDTPAPRRTLPPPPTPTYWPPATIGPTNTRGPKPTLTPSTVPSATPVPTALPLPPSAYYAVWVENRPDDPLDPGEGVIWLADPKDVAGRRPVVHLPGYRVSQLAVSPDGRQIAFTAMQRRQQPSLWVVPVDGGGPTQLAGVGYEVLWTHDGRALVCSTGRAGTSGTAIDVVDVVTGETREVAPPAPDTIRNLLGWCGPGEGCFLSIRPLASPRADELWAVSVESRTLRRVFVSGTDLGWCLLSPDGAKLLYGWGLPQGLTVLDLGTGATREMQRHELGRAIWTPDSRHLVGFARSGSTLLLRTLNVVTEYREDAPLHTLPGTGWEAVSLSPDGQWLAAVERDTGWDGWLHVPSRTLVRVDGRDRGIRTAWALFSRGRQEGGLE